MAWAIGMGLMKSFLVNYSRTMFYQISFVAQTTLKILGTNLSFPCPFPSFILNLLLFLIDVIKSFANVFEYGASIYQAGGVIRAFPAANNRDNAAAIRLTSAPISKAHRADTN